MRQLAIIVAVDEAAGFGKDGKIPWNIPEDMKHFQQVTKGGVCIMGRRTYEDMLAMRRERDDKKGKKIIRKILPGRESFVVSRTPGFTAPGATVVPGIHAVLDRYPDDINHPVFILGGYRMFIDGFNWVDHVFMTIIKGRYDCDLKFPIQVLNTAFTIVDGTETDQLYFVTYQRKGAQAWQHGSQEQVV